MTKRPRIVIVGGGFSGLVAAKRLASNPAAQEYDIVLIDSRVAHEFTPWLYEAAINGVMTSSTGVTVGSTRIAFGEVLNGTRVQFRHAVVAHCDFANGHVVLEGGKTVHYDALILAPGAEVGYFAIPGLETYALPLKCADDAERIREQLSHIITGIRGGTCMHAHVVVCGMGPSGTEFAAELAVSLRKFVHAQLIPPDAVQVTAIDAGERVLPMCAMRTSRKVAQRMQQLGVHLQLQTMVTGVTQDMVSVKRRTQQAHAVEEQRFSYDLLVWCGGATAHSMLAKLDAPKEPRGRIRVGRNGELARYPGVFVVGDAAYVEDRLRSRVVPQTAQAAVYLGRQTADNVVRALQGKRPRLYRIPRRWPIVVTLGSAYGVAEVGGVAFFGYAAYVLRRIADLEYLLRILPMRTAVKKWWR